MCDYVFLFVFCVPLCMLYVFGHVPAFTRLADTKSRAEKEKKRKNVKVGKKRCKKRLKMGEEKKKL